VKLNQKEIKMRHFAELKNLVSERIYDIRRYECEGCQVGACSQKRHSCLLEYDFGYYSKKALEQLKQDVRLLINFLPSNLTKILLTL